MSMATQTRSISSSVGSNANMVSQRTSCCSNGNSRPKRRRIQRLLVAFCILRKMYVLLVLLFRQWRRHPRQGLDREHSHEKYLWKDFEGFEMACQLRVHAH